MTEMISWDDLPRFMDELRTMAQCLLNRESDAASVRPSDLVQSALRRQMSADRWQEVTWHNRRHFFATLHQAMKWTLLDHARRRKAAKRVKTMQVTDLRLHELVETIERQPEQVEALNEVLERLEITKPAWAEMVRLRYYEGLTLEETAKWMDTSVSTLQRWWNRVEPLLKTEILEILNQPE